MWKIKFLEPEAQGLLKKIENTLLTFDLYDSNNVLLKRHQEIAKTEDLKEDLIIQIIKDIKSKIIKVPQNKKDVEKFEEEETDNLTDDIY